MFCQGASLFFTAVISAWLPDGFREHIGIGLSDETFAGNRSRNEPEYYQILMARRLLLILLSGFLIIMPQVVLAGRIDIMQLAVLAPDVVPEAVPRFEIMRYRVEGNTILAVNTIEKLLAPFTGKERDFGTVQEALEALEKEYHRRGYTSVQVILPEQALERGTVLFRVVETSIGTVKVEGNRYFDEKNIRKSVPALKEGLPPNIDRISTNLRTANENPAKKVNLQLQGGEKESEINALLKVTDEKQWKVAFIGDNTGTQQTGYARTGVLLQHANVANLDHVFTAMYTTCPDHLRQVSIYGASYHIPLYAFSDSIDFFGGYSDVDTGSLPMGTSNLNVSGKGTVLGGRYNQTLTRISQYEHKFTYGVDYRDYQNNVDLAGIPLGASVRVNPLSLAYSGSAPFKGVATDFNLALYQNIPVLNGGKVDDFNQVRANAPAGYTVFRYGGNLGYALPEDWQLRFVFNGQYTDSALIPGEQFGLGGAISVRGFQEREISNDRGIFGSGEIYTPNLSQWITLKNSLCRLLAFYDIGQVSGVNPQPGDQGRMTLTSTGIGIRMDIVKIFTLALDYGYVLNPGLTGDRGNSRFHIRAALTF